MPQSGSEPKFESELSRTGPRFSPKFSEIAEPDLKSTLQFNRAPENANPFKWVHTSVTIVRNVSPLMYFRHTTSCNVKMNRSAINLLDKFRPHSESSTIHLGLASLTPEHYHI
jgi:hypothetical protein